jgi:dTDP-4-dehydrorhamnose reductase
MAEQCAARNMPFVHISTDYVFDGTRGEYREDDLPHPVNSYGESKLAGEEAVLTAYPGATVVRTARLFGATGENFVTSLKIPARRGRPIRAVEDERGSFTYAPDMAARLLELLSAGCPSGILHLVGAEAASPYEVAQAVVELFASSSTVTPIAAADLERPAARPADTSLLCTRQPPLRGFRDALPDLFRLRK